MARPIEQDKLLELHPYFHEAPLKRLYTFQLDADEWTFDQVAGLLFQISFVLYEVAPTQAIQRRHQSERELQYGAISTFATNLRIAKREYQKIHAEWVEPPNRMSNAKAYTREQVVMVLEYVRETCHPDAWRATGITEDVLTEAIDILRPPDREKRAQ